MESLLDEVAEEVVFLGRHVEVDLLLVEGPLSRSFAMTVSNRNRLFRSMSNL
ncbi:MAG: hypothetical protein WAT81_02140 [Candidatus Moraniibacteriota bacterium]